ncbi:uncharacterized protein BDZ99DRAFT_469609 [Mytilinidion resinicola]|uniref:Uncharacterized protein n=1 Tax=Mytilinidion resinicola TaxID=574789 RepID=A0A6A6Y080_9PEZI|nr:uncharacterized protein BDZ99DRAFT_469609 [Mytilinidion resinicola]KAF2801625.1 hypothetical protein BDZ99DRAFT_469609 [Mytilinidion resinicola]
MQPSIVLFLAGIVAVANASYDAMQPRSNVYSNTVFSGTSCTGSSTSFVAADGHSCTTIPGGADSMLVDNLGGCSTNFFQSTDCSGAPTHIADANDCVGFADGSRLGSYTTDC